MAKGKKTGGRDFKPGEGGRPRLPEDIKKARQMSLENFLRCVCEVELMTPNEVKGINLDELPLGKRAIINAYAKLDYRAIKDFQDRLWGKAKESIDVTTNDESINKIEFIGIRIADRDS